MYSRMIELMELARSGDEDVALLVASEIALAPESQEEKYLRLMQEAEKYSAEFAPVQQELTDSDLEKMADEAGF